VKRLGYTMAHIWACPPSEGDDYIFHCHPPQQKIPKPKRLQEWYKAMLDKGHKQKIVYEFKDIYKQVWYTTLYITIHYFKFAFFKARDDDLVSPASLPYFEGDYWPNVIEDCIRDAEKEDNERKKIDYDGPVDDEEDDLFQTDDGRSVKNSKSSKKKNNFKKASQKSKKKNGVSTGDKVTDKLYLMLEKHKDVFFTIHLFSPEEEEQAKRNPIVDPDGLVSSELMDGRDTFLSRSREEHWEFSSLRRAKWSSTNLCYSLHNQDQNKDMPNYNCNECETTHNVKYHCTNCEVWFFWLCFSFLTRRN
jgi:E1A/CREB-binding protein